MSIIESVTIAGRFVGPGHPPLIVAELSGNHNGTLARALALIDAAADAGADAVKFQTYTADTITIDHAGPGFVIDGGLWDGRKLYDLYDEAHTPWEWHAALFEHAARRGLMAFSAPFDATSVDFLETLNCPVYKIASFECIDTPLIRRAAATGKPIIISTGLTNRQEISDAVTAARVQANGVILLHCLSAYPAPAEQFNLSTIPALATEFSIPIGLSDHTMGNTSAIAAIALGACVIEKHLTLKRSDGGPDAAFSMEPEDLAALVAECKIAWSALGTPRIAPSEAEKSNVAFRRSLYIVSDVPMGTVLTEQHVRSIRPGFGLPPSAFDRVLGKRAARDLTRGTPLQWTDIIEESSS